jgi:hypothetical protein
MKLLDPGEDSINLEGEAPSCGLFVVFFQHIDVLSIEVLPFSHWLFNPFSLRHLLSKYFQEGGFSTSYISLYSVAKIVLWKLRIKGKVLHILIEVSR